jgi:hypothetical protein
MTTVGASAAAVATAIQRIRSYSTRNFAGATAARLGGSYSASSSDIRPPGSRAERFDLRSVGSIFLSANTSVFRTCWPDSEPVDGAV